MTAAPELPAPGARARRAPDLAGAAARSWPELPLAREWQLPFPLDARLSLSVHRRGGGDPAYAVDAAGAVWRTSLTPDGPATLRVRSRPAPQRFRAPALPRPARRRCRGRRFRRHPGDRAGLGSRRGLAA
jgi:hypothetical protein